MKNEKINNFNPKKKYTFIIPSNFYSKLISYSKEIITDDISKILENTEKDGGTIFLGNISSAKNINLLNDLGIKAVISLDSKQRVSYYDDEILFHKVITAKDEEFYDLSQHFNEIFEFIEEKRRFTNILIHCYAGKSRSVAIIIAYLIKKYHMKFEEAFSFVKNKRKEICPNLGFIQQLKKFEEEIFKEKTIFIEKIYLKNKSQTIKYLSADKKKHNFSSNNNNFLDKLINKNKIFKRKIPFYENFGKFYKINKQESCFLSKK